MNPKINKIIVFDLGGVLIKLKNPDLFVSWLNKNCFRKKIKKSFLELSFEEIHRGKLSVKEWYNSLVENCGLKVNWKEFKENFCKLHLDNEIKGVEMMLESLKKKYRLFLLSNTCREHIEYCKKKFPKLFTYFNRIFFSYLYGFIKPEKEIYQIVMKKENKDSQFLLVDDTQENIIKAQKLHWHTFKVCRNKFNPQEFLSLYG